MRSHTRHRVRQVAAVTLVIGGIAVVWMGVLQSQADRTAAAATPTVFATSRPIAPDFALPDLNGKTIRLSEFAGKVRIVDFWATWCPPCRKEIPHFQSLYTAYRDRGLVVLGVALDEQGASVVRPFAQKMNMTYLTVIGDEQVTRAYGGIRGIPTTFVIDRAGRIYRIYVGYQEKATFERDVQTLLAEEGLTTQ